MAINFPDSPSNGDTVTVGDKTWTWNGSTWDVVVSTPISNQIIDADGDTRVHVEESPDEDYLRFDTAGTERMTINPSGNVAMTGDLTVTGTIAGGSTTFPTTLDSGTMPAIEALQAKVGADSSAVATSHDYKIDALETDVTNINEHQLNTIISSDHTLVLTDAGKLIEVSSTSAQTVTIPPYSSVAFPVGTQILVTQLGNGQVSIAPGSGVTLNSKDGNRKLSATHCGVTLIKTRTDTWVALGDLSA
jgi:hypothetical protein